MHCDELSEASWNIFFCKIAKERKKSSVYGFDFIPGFFLVKARVLIVR